MNVKWMNRAVFPALLGLYGVLLVLWPERSMPLLSGFAVAGVLLERLLPYHAAWGGLGSDSKVDSLYSLLSIATSSLAQAGLTIVFASVSLRMELWPAHWPLFARVGLALAVSGLLPYWMHRIAHEKNRFLWDVHAVHHAPERVYSLNALRAHPLNTIWNTVLGLAPLALMGADRETILIAGGLNNFFSLYNHMNIDFTNRWLSRVFNTAELHRWHHSVNPEFGNANYSSGALALWDHVFGTWKLPEEKMERTGAGLYGRPAAFPAFRFFKQLAYPFCRCA
jgi:sterol desaturase/sphingolipid hydroxylase (fatty acid hydroxylase superfamily)